MLTRKPGRRSSNQKEMVGMTHHEKEVSPKGLLSDAKGRMFADRSSNDGDDPVLEQDQIRMRAYELYLERGAQPSDGLEDWLQAERELQRSPDERIDAQESPPR
jgi:hypothetical protein